MYVLICSYHHIYKHIYIYITYREVAGSESNSIAIVTVQLLGLKLITSLVFQHSLASFFY